MMKMKSKLLRLLTFVCFFQFSGINNGYTILTSVSPLNATQSTSCLSSAIAHFHSTVRPQSVVSLLRSGQEYIVAFTAGSESALRGLFNPDSAAHAAQMKAGGTDSGSGYRSRFETRRFSSLNKKEAYIKLEKKSWSREDGFRGWDRMSRVPRNRVDAQSGKTLLAAGSERFDLKWKRIMSRKFGGPLDGESAQIYITRSRI